MRFADASAYEIMWSHTVVVEIGALDEAAPAPDTDEGAAKKEASDA